MELSMEFEELSPKEERVSAPERGEKSLFAGSSDGSLDSVPKDRDCIELPVHASCEADFYRPLFAYLHAKKMGKDVPPYIPKWDLLPLHKQCVLALLWKEAGLIHEAGLLASWILKLEPFPSLWCRDSEFNKDQIARCFARLKEIEPLEGTGPSFLFSLIKSARLKAALTLDGRKTSMGVIHAGIEIPAFGPQRDPLNFGIDGFGLDGWTRTAADSEIWIEMQHEAKDEGLNLEFRFIGIRPEKPISMAFYVRAQSCSVGGVRLMPKSLRRYQGETKEIELDGKCLIESREIQKVEVIPLAGGGCYWDADFLITYPFSIFSPQIALSITCLSSIAK